VHPPVSREEGDSPVRKNKKRKKIYQTGVEVDDLNIEDFVE
jgi:hypothetical protein